MMDFIAIVKNIMSDDGSVSVKHHIGITVHISSISNVKRVDYHTFYLPYEGKAIDIKANRIEQWKNLCSFIDDIHDNFSSLQPPQLCHAEDAHTDQLKWVEYRECHLFISQLHQPTLTRLEKLGQMIVNALASNIMEIF